MKKEEFYILALESSADETSAAVMRGDEKGGQILSNIIFSQIKEHQKTGGIVPEVAARAHIPKIIPSIEKALAEANPPSTSPLNKGGNVGLFDIDAIAVTNTPGLVSSLLIGADTGRALAFALDKPLIAVNHMEGHLLSALADANSKFEARNPKLFPTIGLVVSGGHTMLVLVRDTGKYEILGQTIDDAAGEAFDKTAKILGLSYPGGPAIAARAAKFEARNPKFETNSKFQIQNIELPRPMIDSDDFNFSFSGLKTAVLYKVRELKEKNQLTEKVINRLCFEIEQAIVDVLTEKTLKAVKEYKVKTVLLGGGVSANKTLRLGLENKLNNTTDYGLLSPVSSLTTDNAGMIALAAYFHYLENDFTDVNEVQVKPREKLKSWRQD